MFLNSVEYQMPLTAKDRVVGVAFLDSGTVESRIDRWTDYRVSAGFGFRFVVPLMGPVPIALDFGFPIVKGAADQKQMFSFYLGFYKF
jgi:outer membrane protein insertion porin family